MDNSEGIYHNENFINAKIFQPPAPTIHFKGADDIEIMRLEPNGDIYVHEKLVENDKQVVDGMRHFLLSHGY